MLLPTSPTAPVTTRVVSPVSRAWALRALKDYISTRLFRNAAYLWLNTMVISGFGFVFWTAASRLYPADAVGQAAAAIAAITLIAMFAPLGLGIGIVRFLPESRGSGVALVNSVLLVTLAASLVASAVFLLGLDLWSPGLSVVREHPLFIVTFIAGACAFSLSQVVDRVFVATRLAGFVLMRNVGLGILRLLLLVSLAFFFASFGIVAAHAVAAGLLVAASFVALLPAALKGYRLALEWKPRRILSMLSFSLSNHVAVLLLGVPGGFFTLMVLNTSGPEDAAYFYIAWTIGMAVSSVSSALATSLFAEGSHNPAHLRDQALKAIRGGMPLALLATLVVVAAAHLILRVFGSDYAANGTTLLRLLALASLPALFVRVYISVARVEKRISAIVLIAGTVATVSLLAGYALVRSMGLEGVGIAWLASQASALAVAAAILTKRGQIFASGFPCTGAVVD